MRGRPLTPQARLAQAARTRNQAKASTSQEPPRREHEPGKRKEAVEVEDDDDEEEEDERLRREEDQRAEQRARKKGSRGEAEPVIHDGPPKKKKYVDRLEERFDVEKVIDWLLEGHNDLMTLKEILASAPRLRDELKGRLSRRLVPNVHLGTILPKEAEWAESSTKMDWKCVACGTVDLMVKGSKCAATVDTGAEMNIIREADAIRFGLDIDRSDCGTLHGASCKAMFCGTASNVLVEVRKIGAIEERIQEASDQVARSRMDDKARWDQSARVRKVPLAVGDAVLLYDSSLEKQWSRKLDKRWLGLYRIIRIGDFGAYQIEELNGTEWKDWVSGTRLKKFVAREEVPQEEVPREEVPREEAPREEVPREEAQGTQQESRLGDMGRRAGKKVIEVGEDTPPQAPAMGLRLGDAPGSARQAEERLWREEAPLLSSERAPSPEGRAGRRRERAAVRREALTLIDRHLAAYALEHPDLEEPAPAEPRQEPYQPEKEMEAEIPKRVDLRTRERAPAGETAEEKKARRTRRINEIWQERQRLEAAGELSEQQQERQRWEAAGALPGQPPSAPTRAPEIHKMWRDFWEQRGEELPLPVRAGFGVARKAEERLDRKIKFLAKTTFDRHLLLEGDLTGKKMKEASHGVRLEAMEMEIQELRALVASQTAIIESLRQQTQGRVDRPESCRQGEQRQPGQGLPGQPSAAEPRQEPPMGRVILEPEEARAQRQAEREAFEFRAPTKLATLPVAAAGPVVPLAVEEGLPLSSSEPAQGSAEGSMGVLLEVVHTMQEEVSLFSPEQRIEEPLEREIGIEAESAIESRLQRIGTPKYGPEGIEEHPIAVPGDTLEKKPQRLDTPEYVPVTGDLRNRLGFWATGSGSGRPVPGTEQQEVVSTAAPQSEQQGVVSTLAGSPSSPPPQPRKKKFRRKVDQLCFYCKRSVHHALGCLEFLEDKAAGKVSEAGGRIVEKSADGLRTQLYRQNQEELRR
ncbi:hypothetical protein CBR_g22450 [Chara braunii]|uniref:Peptidase A2 domain-containing protein n=1 Tax=Chara braunii TaxID=69332 RepID=A0A388L2P1_CHABU|nr:hypothetical protein CBR_g22450 [Chara braunii]|eukprot:GBG76569.1 hypothetical protein CBR_g22450 [Chara braunii]